MFWAIFFASFIVSCAVPSFVMLGMSVNHRDLLIENIERIIAYSTIIGLLCAHFITCT